MPHLESLRETVYDLVEPVSEWLVERNVHPNLITTLGFMVTASSGFFFHQHHVSTAGFLVLLGGAFDLFDGLVARESGLASKFGAFYDSTLDRISEIAVYLGLLSLYNDYRVELGDVGMIYLIMLAMAGSLMISYTRSRAETLGLDCKVGLMQRPERVVFIGLAALLFGERWDGLVLKGVIALLAVLTNFTAIQRIVWVYRRAGGVPLDPDADPAPADAGSPSEREFESESEELNP